MALTDLLSGLGRTASDLGGFLNQNAEMRHLEKVMSANPQFGSQLYAAKAGLEDQMFRQRQEREQMRQRDALRAIAPKFRSGMNMQDALSEYAALTGDITPLVRVAGNQDTANIREFNLAQSNPAFAEYMNNRRAQSVPAALKIAQEMDALSQIASDVNRTPAERRAAQNRYNLIGQAAKTYGFGQGTQYDFGADMPTPTDGTFAPDVTPDVSEPLPAGDFTDSGFEDPVVTANREAAAAQAVKLGGYNPYARDDALPVVPSSDPVITPVTGYDELQAKRAADKAAAEAQAKADIELETAPKIAEETEKSKIIGKDLGEKLVELKSRVSRMPQLNNVVKRLAKLGDIATYTNTGQIKDAAKRELGLDVGDAAAARKAYVSMVDNEVLPLLRETFGAQFTQKEGESLKVTLGDPDASPREKRAVLRSFITTKMETINTTALAAGQEPVYSDEEIQAASDAIATETGNMPQPASSGGIKFLGFE